MEKDEPRLKMKIEDEEWSKKAWPLIKKKKKEILFLFLYICMWS